MCYFPQVTPGLGQSEEFYSWLISSFNIGALAGSITVAILDRLLVPIWYLWFGCIAAHIIGFVIRGVTYIPALVTVSMFLAGYFSGGHYPMVYIYLARSTAEYEKYLKAECGDKAASGKGKAIRNHLINSIVVAINAAQVIANGKLINRILVYIHINHL